MSNSGIKVLVTGGTGYISSWTIKLLLEGGYSVRATVRDPKSHKCDFIKELPGASERLELVPGDLLSANGWDDAVKGCTYVHHIASPYSLNVKDPQKDLVDPAVNGTLFVLKACKACPDVTRVILTSSVAAISDCFDDWKTHTYGPDDWNTTSSLSRNPYYYSKVLAEKAAHEFIEKEKPAFDLAVINPFMVIGPSLEKNGAINTSVSMLNRITFGNSPTNLPLACGIIDVRDVALAHVRAMEIKEAAGKRFILCAGSIQQYELSQKIKNVVPDKLKRKISTSPPLPFLTRSFIYGFLRLTDARDVATFVYTNWGKIPKFDTSLTKDVLHIEFQDIDVSVKDTVEWLLNRKA